MPVEGFLPGQRGYQVAAAETGAGRTDSWGIEAYAICLADPNNRLDVTTVRVESGTVPGSKATLVAPCPAGKVVLGTGAQVKGGNGGVMLQVSGAWNTGDRAGAQAQEVPGGYSGNWSLTSFAICAKPPSGYAVHSRRTDQGAGPNGNSHVEDSWRSASRNCPAGTFLYGGGATLPSDAPANVALTAIIPGPVINNFPPNNVTVSAEESPGTSAGWSLTAQAICAATPGT